MKGRLRQPEAYLPLLASILAILVYTSAPGRLRLNLSPSEPIGLYLELSAPPSPGALVCVCLPPSLAQEALRRHYLAPGSCPSGAQPLIKTISGVPGDVVSLDSSGVRINGTRLAHSAPRSKDRSGRPLRPTSFRGTIPPGQLWFSGSHPLSWDSRFFGPLPASTVRCTLKPLFILQKDVR